MLPHEIPDAHPGPAVVSAAPNVGQNRHQSPERLWGLESVTLGKVGLSPIVKEGVSQPIGRKALEVPHQYRPNAVARSDAVVGED